LAVKRKKFAQLAPVESAPDQDQQSVDLIRAMATECTAEPLEKQQRADSAVQQKQQESRCNGAVIASDDIIVPDFSTHKLSQF
jgi:hypothetical protein